MNEFNCNMSFVYPRIVTDYGREQAMRSDKAWTTAMVKYKRERERETETVIVNRRN
jgi:hypothetical protein